MFGEGLGVGDQRLAGVVDLKKGGRWQILSLCRVGGGSIKYLEYDNMKMLYSFQNDFIPGLEFIFPQPSKWFQTCQNINEQHD